jgi:UPF0271 protein
MFSTPAGETLRLVETSRILSGIEIRGLPTALRGRRRRLHSRDTRGAVDIARGLREALKDSGIEVAPFKVSQG